MSIQHRPLNKLSQRKKKNKKALKKINLRNNKMFLIKILTPKMISKKNYNNNRLHRRLQPNNLSKINQLCQMKKVAHQINKLIRKVVLRSNKIRMFLIKIRLHLRHHSSQIKMQALRIKLTSLRIILRGQTKTSLMYHTLKSRMETSQLTGRTLTKLSCTTTRVYSQ